MKKRLFGILLSFALMMGMMPVLGMTQTVYAAETWSSDLTIDSSRTIDGGVVVTDDVTVTIAENVTLTVNGGISAGGKTLTVEGKGNLKVTGSNGIKGDDGDPGGPGNLGGPGGNGIVVDNLIINGAKVIIDGGDGGAGGDGGNGVDTGGAGGIGGAGGKGVEGTVTVNSGSITATGGNGGRGGIGGYGVDIGGPGGPGGKGVEGTVTVSIGSATVTGGAGGRGGAGGIGGIGGSTGGAGADGRAASGALYGQTVQESDDSENWTDVSGTISTKRYVKIEGADGYPLWVKGVQVTNANQDDVLADDPINKGKVSYAPDAHTLTLDGANITADNEKQHNYSAIHYGDAENELIIDATKDSTVTGPNYDDPKEKTSYGVSSESRVTVRGKLTVEGRKASSSFGVFAPAFVVEDKAESKVRGESGGVFISEGTDARITVRGKLTAEGGDYGIYFNTDSTGNNVTVSSGAELTATGGLRGIVPNSEDGYVEIEKGAKVRATGGTYGAVDGTVKNAVPGLGWTNSEGTEGKTYFDIDTQGRALGDDIKCAEFPAAEASVTMAPMAKSLKYNGSAQELVTDGEAKDGVMQYALGKDGTTPPEKGWSASIPKRTEAGTYYVWYMAEGDATHADSEPQGPLKVTISKGVAVPAVVTADSRKYDGTEKPLVTVTGKASGGVMQYALGIDGTTPPEKGWSVSVPAGKDTGVYYVWYKAVGDNNHSDSDAVCVTVTISEKDPDPAEMSTITFDLNGGTWDGMTGIVKMDVENGTVITLPAPAREGYTFDYWEGSRYNAGDQYTVNGDHTFKAVWKTADNGGNGKGGSSKGAKTGDDNTFGAWIVLLVAVLTGTTGMAFARKRRND